MHGVDYGPTGAGAGAGAGAPSHSYADAPAGIFSPTRPTSMFSPTQPQAQARASTAPGAFTFGSSAGAAASSGRSYGDQMNAQYYPREMLQGLVDEQVALKEAEEKAKQAAREAEEAAREAERLRQEEEARLAEEARREAEWQEARETLDDHLQEAYEEEDAERLGLAVGEMPECPVPYSEEEIEIWQVRMHGISMLKTEGCWRCVWVEGHHPHHHPPHRPHRRHYPRPRHCHHHRHRPRPVLGPPV